MVISVDGCSTLASRDSKHVCALRLVTKSWVTFCNWARTSDWYIYNELVGHEFETPNAEHAIEMQNLFQLY